MTTPDSLIRAVQSVLNTKATRDGQTTKQEAVILVLRRIENAGGPTRFGLGAAAMRMALAHLIEIEVTRQLKQGLTEHEYLHVLPAHTPMEVIAALGKVPRWIAVSEGAEALWIPSLQATPGNWFANAALKERKAAQTQAKADVSTDIGRFLAMNSFNSLAEAISLGV
jgi:hypothetical protein